MGCLPTFVCTNFRREPLKGCLGLAANVVGGFAGGERGLRLFVEEGDFIIADPEQGDALTCLATLRVMPVQHSKDSCAG